MWHPLVQHLMLVFMMSFALRLWRQGLETARPIIPCILLSATFPQNTALNTARSNEQKSADICHPSGFQNIENRSMHKLQSQGSPVRCHQSCLRPSGFSFKLHYEELWVHDDLLNQRHDDRIFMFYSIKKYVVIPM